MNSAKILVVDDNPVVLLGLVELLKQAGHEPLEARTGQECLEVVRRERPDLVLLDVVLPDMSGVELCGKIKGLPEMAAGFVVLISALEVSCDKLVAGLDSGADGYIARPIPNRELLARVQSMLRIQQAEAALRQARADLERRVGERTAALSEANAQLRTLSQRLVEVQEAERRDVARELHDEVGQLLTSLRVCIELALREPPEAREAGLRDALSLVEDLTTRTRRLSLNLRPQILDDLGLLPALDWHLRRLEQQTGLRVSFRHGPFGRRLPPLAETTIFRIVQEALTNVARHAGVTAATVLLWANEDSCRVQVQDGGRGFDPAQTLRAHASTGLTGMRERTALLGGEFFLESAPGRGTKLTVELPLRAPPDAAEHDANPDHGSSRG